MSDYKRKLADPRWQKKRLKILERDNWTCQKCGDTKTELQIHHEKYTGQPWDAPDEDLVTLCANCHESISIVAPTYTPLNATDILLALAIQYPSLAKDFQSSSIREDLCVIGAHGVVAIFDNWPNREDANMNCVVEHFRQSDKSEYIEQLANLKFVENEEMAKAEFIHACSMIISRRNQIRLDQLIRKSKEMPLTAEDRDEMKRLMMI